MTQPHRRDGDDDALSVGDPDTWKTRLCREMCTTCVFRPGNPMRLGPGRLKTLIDEALAAERFIICHATLPYATDDPAVRPAVCRGFYDRYGTLALRLIVLMFGFTEVDPPPTSPHAGPPAGGGSTT